MATSYIKRIPSVPVAISQGGTNATTAADARTNLGVPSVPVTVAQGGTNATTAANARSNLGVKRYAVEEYVKDNVSINGPGNTGNLDITVSKSGYNAIGVVGFYITNATSSGQNSTWCTMLYCMRTSNSNVRVRVCNVGTSTAKVKITVYVLFEG